MLTKIKQVLNNYFRRFTNPVFHLINFHILFFVVLTFLKVLLILINKEILYHNLVYKFILPGNFVSYLKQPWSIISYFLYQDKISSLFFNMLILYNFGNILSQLLYTKRLFFIYFSGTIFAGLFYVLLIYLSPRNNFLTGCSNGIYSVLFSCIAFAPNFPINLLFLGNIKLKYIGLIFLLFSFSKLSEGRIEIGLTEMASSFWGFIYIKLMSKSIELGKPFFILFNFIKKKCVKKYKNNIYVSFKKNKK